jgi:hypothetical protein
MKKASALLLCGLFVFMLATAVYGDETKQQPEPIEEKQEENTRLDDRVIKGHRFMRPETFPLAIPTTNIGNHLGYYIWSYEYEYPIELGGVKESNFAVGGLSEQFDFEFEFLNRISFETTLRGQVVSGITENTVYFQGARVDYRINFIPKVMILQSDKWGGCLSFSSSLSYRQFIHALPVILVETVIEEATEDLEEDIAEEIDQQDAIGVAEEVEDRFREVKGSITAYNFVTEEKLTVLNPAILYAQSLHPTFGIQVGTGFKIGLKQEIDTPPFLNPLFKNEKPPMAYWFAFSPEFDLAPVSPIGLGISSELRFEIEKDDDRTTRKMGFGLGLGYSGRDNFDFRLRLLVDTKERDISTTFINLGKLKTRGSGMGIHITTKYYF